jgi:hypothetical protein
MRRLAGLWLVLLILGLRTECAAHDIYTDLHSDGSVGSGDLLNLCCSGSENEGDCEGISDPVLHPDGSASFFSRRWNQMIKVAAGKIVWKAIPGGERFPAHFCGVPRNLMGYIPPDSELQIDPIFYVYCAFVSPYGT